MRHEALKALSRLAAVGMLALISSCGFQLRGQSPLPFASAYVEAPADSVVATRLRKYLAIESKLSDARDKADTIIRLSGENRSKTILSLSGSGKVREYRLQLRLTVSATDTAGREVLAPASFQLSRDYSYSDAQLLAKEAEEAVLLREMEEDALRQIVRRLAFLRPS